MADLAPGSRIGNYTIERLVGRGGFGAVYVAHDRRLSRRVALKVLDPALAADERARKRFLDESRQAASLDHPNIIPIYEAGSAGEQPFLAMRYVPGPDLDGTIARDGPLAPARAARIVAQVASALDAAHGVGLVHRDVKPGNVLLAAGSDGAEHAYLTDFGLSKRVGGTGAVSQTHAGQFVGTVGYVAPEQIKGRAVDARADIYSLGCLAFNALTGQAPFARDSEIDTLMAHVDAAPPSVHATLPELADRVDLVLARAMAKDPAARHPTAGAFATDLAAALATKEPSGTITRGFLFADLRGYTAFIEAHGDAAAVGLLDTYRRLVRDVVKRFGGAEIKTEGDSFYVVFPSASGAVSAGLAITAAADEATARDPALPVTVGVGVHAGESTETAEGYVGSSVNIAARVCAQAAAGEVLVTDTVRTLIRTSLPVSFVARGKRQLKGIAEPMALFAVSIPGEATANGGGQRKTSTAALGTGGSGPRGPILAGAAVLVIAVLVVGGLLVAGGLPGTGPGATPTIATGAANGGGTPAVPAGLTGSRIIFSRQVPFGTATADSPVRCDGPNDAKLYVLDPDQPAATPYRLMSATDLYEQAPSWSADGTTVTFTALVQNAGADYRRTDPSGAAPSTIVERPTGRRIPLAPDARVDAAGATIAYVLEGNLWVAAIDGTGARRIAGSQEAPDASPAATADAAVPASFSAVAWTPDGRLAIIGGDATGLVQVGTLGADGTGFRAIDLTLGELRPVDLAVSPDGQTLAIVRSDDATGLTDLALTSMDGGALTPITADGVTADHPAWSPDGTRLAFSAASSAGADIWVADIATGAVHQLTDEGGVLGCSPAWGRATADLATPQPPPSEPYPFERGILPAGRYAIDRFQPAMEMTVGDGWFADRDYADAWAILRVGDPVAEELVGSLITVGRTGPCPEDASVVLGTKPQDLYTWLQSRADLAVSNPAAINLGGHPGIAFDVTAVTPCPSSTIAGLFETGQDSVWLDTESHDTLRLYAVDVGGTTVTFQAFSNESAREAFQALVDPVLQTVTFTP